MLNELDNPSITLDCLHQFCVTCTKGLTYSPKAGQQPVFVDVRCPSCATGGPGISQAACPSSCCWAEGPPRGLRAPDLATAELRTEKDELRTEYKAMANELVRWAGQHRCRYRSARGAAIASLAGWF